MKTIPVQKYLSYALFVSCFAMPLSAQTVLEQEWATPKELKEPESVIYDTANDVLYVSNINNPAGGKDGNGSIGRVSTKGEIIEVEWVLGGMDSPKGLGLVDNLLYVADLQKVVVIDINTGKVTRNIEIKDAGMLNDITTDSQGTVYVSDSDKAKVYQIRNNKAELWLDNKELQKPNGLLAHRDKFYLVDMGTGIFYEVLKDSKRLRKIAEGLQGGDGIVAYEEDFIISNWNGEVWEVTANGKVTKLLDTKAEKINAADLAYLPEEKLLLVPTFYGNNLVAYKVR